jgi:precorrin-2 dehydrogenase/sirohydrochlorin ferrochelatase
MPEMYPIFLKLENRPVLVVGAGRVALRKVEALLESGADVRVVAPIVCAELLALSGEGKLSLSQREWRPDDCDAALLVIAATGDSALNARVRIAAQGCGALINAVDDPPNCDFYTPAVTRIGELLVAISTQGHVPLIAGRVKAYLQKMLPAELSEVIHAVSAERKRILATEPEEAGRLTKIKAFLDAELARRNSKL